MTPVTAWYRLNPHNRQWLFNHIEDGHSVKDKPEPKSQEQAGWKRAQWTKYACWLTAAVPPRLVHYGPEDLKT